MTDQFRPDSEIEELAAICAQDAVDDALRNMKIPLDWSEASVESVEIILGRLHDSLDRAKPAQKLIFAIAREFGSYVGEVFIRHRGGRWGVVTLDGKSFPGICAAKDNALFWPWGRAQNRLEGGAEYNIWHYYRRLTDNPM